MSDVAVIIKLAIEILSLITDLRGLLERIEAGEEITNEEIIKAQKKVKDAVDNWFT